MIFSENLIDETIGNCSFNIGKLQIVICHFFKEVGNRKFVLLIPYLF